MSFYLTYIAQEYYSAELLCILLQGITQCCCMSQNTVPVREATTMELEINTDSRASTAKYACVCDPENTPYNERMSN